MLKLKKMGGRVFLVTSYKKNPIRFLAEIRKIVKQGGYDIIHGHEAIMSLPALCMGKKYKVPVRIAHSHSVGMTSPVKELIASVSRHAFERYCTDVMACSKMAGIICLVIRYFKKGDRYFIMRFGQKSMLSKPR